MKYIIVVDEKPESCKECLFFTEKFEVADKPNVVNLCDKCLWGAKDHSECPLTVVNTLFVHDNDKKD